MSKPQYIQYQVAEPDSPFLGDLLYRCLRNWPWFLVAIGLSLGGAYLYLHFKQPVYLTRASLIVDDKQVVPEQSNALREIQKLTPKVVENEIEVLHSFPLMRKVVEKLNLNVHYFKPTGLSQWEVYEESPIRIKIEKSTPELFKEPLSVTVSSRDTVLVNGRPCPVARPIQLAAGRIRVEVSGAPSKAMRPVKVEFASVVGETEERLKALTIESAGLNSSVIRLSLEDVLSNRGEAVLTQLVREYRQAGLAEKDQRAASTMQFIEQRISGLANDIAQVESEVERYKVNQGITDLSAQAESLLKNAQNIDTDLNQIAIQLATLDDLDKYLNQQVGKRGTAPAVLGLQDPILKTLLEKLMQLEQQRDDMSKFTADQNILVQGLDDQIKATQGSIRSNVQSRRSMLNSSRQQLEVWNDRSEDKIRSIPQKERKLMDITRRQSIKNELYTYMLQKREEAAITFTANLPDSQLIEPAYTGVNPVKPNRAIIFGFFSLLGLLFPTAFIFVLELLNDRIRRREDVEEQTDIPILGEIIREREFKDLVITATKDTLAADQIRTLRANLLQMQRESSHSLMVMTTSTMSGEGKSFLSLNISVSLGLAGHPTVLVDLDFRSPKHHQTFGLSNQRGVSDFLNGKYTLDELLQPIAGYDNFYLLPSGPITSSPAEFLCNPRLERMYEELKNRFAFVVTDTPPIGIVSDAQLLAPFADATLYVVRHDLTPKSSLAIINDLNDKKHFSKMFVVLNAVSEKASYHISSNYRQSQRYYSRGQIQA